MSALPILTYNGQVAVCKRIDCKRVDCKKADWQGSGGLGMVRDMLGC